MRYLKEDLAYYHEKVTKDLASLARTRDRELCPSLRTETQWNRGPRPPSPERAFINLQPDTQTTAAPPLPRPHRLPPTEGSTADPGMGPQTTHLPPISTQTEGGQTGNTDRTGTPVLTLDTNGDQTGETNEIDYDEVEEISILPDEERFQVKQVEKEEVKEKKEQENETGGAKEMSQDHQEEVYQMAEEDVLLWRLLSEMLN
ncbi:hypothetical protein J4Q44_G00326600 [Coregonus suidteri]|uniref:Uncharacterized protein n=1 Tax=Coregonus suidteri TaxID=861788 RepID=A0AAN8KRY9_9TELE